MRPTNDLLEAALAYEKQGFSVIPVGHDKKPLIKWEPYQRRKADPDEIQNWFAKWPNMNIAIVTGPLSGLLVVDADTTEGITRVDEAIPDSLLVPCQRTPKRGKHFFFSHEEGFTNRARVAEGIDVRTTGGYVVVAPSVNRNGGGWQWLDGLSLLQVEPPALPDAVKEILNSNSLNSFKRGGYRGGEDVTDVTMFEYGRRDNDLFTVANSLVKGGMPEAEIFQVLDHLALSWGEKADPKWLWDKIRSAQKRSARRDLNLAQEIRQWVSVTNGDFSVTDAFKSLQSVTSVTKRDTVRQILYRMWKEGEIQKAGKADGVYRRIETEFEEIDFLNAPSKCFEIRWPFHIEKWIKIFPKSIIVLAGESNAGKTAFMINVAWLNQNVHKIRFLSSEMESNLWQERLSKFGEPLGSWKFLPVKCSSNYRDAVIPDALNLVDFLEIHDEFYKLSLYLKEIYERLTTGVAVVAIQKNKGSEWGLGGERGVEKATLYLSIEPGRIKILKGKNWQGEVNPNHLQLDFKLVQGCKFIVQRDWYRP